MSQRFIEVTTDHPTNEEPYKLLLQIEQIVQIYDNYGYETEVLAASIRHPMHVVEAAMIGADVATMPFDVIKKLLNHPLTDAGLKRFLADWDDYKADLGAKTNGEVAKKKKPKT